jgi:hypothetical protein
MGGTPDGRYSNTEKQLTPAAPAIQKNLHQSKRRTVSFL